jgi:ribonuclease PH
MRKSTMTAAVIATTLLSGCASFGPTEFNGMTLGQKCLENKTKCAITAVAVTVVGGVIVIELTKDDDKPEPKLEPIGPGGG